MKSKVLFLFAVCAFLIAVIPSSAQIVNGGFETGNLHGWHASGLVNVTSKYHHSGNYAVCLGVTGTPFKFGKIYQYVDLSGAKNISFWYYNPSTSGALSVDINGSLVLSLGSSTSTWKKEVINVTKWKGLSKLTFLSTITNPSTTTTQYLYIDDIAVNYYKLFAYPNTGTMKMSIKKTFRNKHFGMMEMQLTDTVNHMGRWIYIPLSYLKEEVGTGHYVFFLKHNNSSMEKLHASLVKYHGVECYRVWIPHFSTNTLIAEAWHGHYNITIPDASPGNSYSVYIRGAVDNATVRFVGRGITVPTLDNAGGGSWSKYAVFTFASAIPEYAQYEIVINGTSWKLYNSTGSLKYEGTNDQFWSNVNTTWLTDLRFFSNEGELPYWIEFPKVDNDTVVTINTTAGISYVSHFITLRGVVGSDAKLRFIVKNSSTLPATIDVYVNGHEIGSVALPATTNTYTIEFPASYLVDGKNNITFSAVGTIDTAEITWSEIVYVSNCSDTSIWVNVSAGSKYIGIAYGNPVAGVSNYKNISETFNVFDSFENNSILTITYGDSGSYKFVQTNAIFGNYSIQYTDDSSTSGGWMDANTSYTRGPFVEEIWVDPNLNGAVLEQSVWLHINSSIIAGFHNELWYNVPRLEITQLGVGTLHYKSITNWVQNEWYIIKIVDDESYHVHIYLYKADGELLAEYSPPGIYPPDTIGFYIGTGSGQTGHVYVDGLTVWSARDPASVTGFFVGLTGNPSISVNGKTATYYGGLVNGEVSPPVILNSSWFINGTNTIVFNSAIGSADILINASYIDNVTINVTRSPGLIEQSATYSPATNATGEAWFNVSFGVNMTVYSLNVKLNGSNYTDYEFNCPNLSIHIPSVTAGATYSFYIKVLYNNPPHVNISIPNTYTTMNNSSVIYHCLVGEPVHFNLIYTDPENNSLYSVLWDFGDGVTSSMVNPIHTYTRMGYYRVSVSATDNGYVKHLTGTKNITILITGDKVSHSHIHTIVITNNYISVDGHKTYMLGGRTIIGSNYIQIGNTVIPVCINNLTAGSAHALAKVMNYMPINDSITIIKSLENSSMWDAMNVTYSPYLNSTVRNEIIQELGI